MAINWPVGPVGAPGFANRVYNPSHRETKRKPGWVRNADCFTPCSAAEFYFRDS
jgi:hypothetical protein